MKRSFNRPRIRVLDADQLTEQGIKVDDELQKQLADKFRRALVPKRTKPRRGAAAEALKALYPDGTPEPHVVPNAELLVIVNRWLAGKKPKREPVKMDSLLRAAGRRRK